MESVDPSVPASGAVWQLPSTEPVLKQQMERTLVPRVVTTPDVLAILSIPKNTPMSHGPPILTLAPKILLILNKLMHDTLLEIDLLSDLLNILISLVINFNESVGDSVRHLFINTVSRPMAKS